MENIKRTDGIHGKAVTFAMIMKSVEVGFEDSIEKYPIVEFDASCAKKKFK